MVCGWLGDYTEGAAVVVLFAVAAWLEAGCGCRARDAVSDVVAMQPATATLGDSGKSRRLTLEMFARLKHPHIPHSTSQTCGMVLQIFLCSTKVLAEAYATPF